MFKTLVCLPCGCQHGRAGRISRRRGRHRLARPTRVVADVEPEAISSAQSVAQASPLFLDCFWLLLQCSSFVFGIDRLPRDACTPCLASSSF
jgi:hypothetical protein